MPLTVITVGFIKSDEFDKIQKRIDELSGKEGQDLLERAVTTVAEVSIEIAQVEPPEKTPAPGRPFYKRGTGMIGRTTGQPIGGRATSEDLSNAWVSRVRSSPGRATAIIINRASYASYVVGKLTQAAIHRGRWSTIEDIVEYVIGEAGAVTPEVDLSQTSLPSGAPLTVQLENDLFGDLIRS